MRTSLRHVWRSWAGPRRWLAMSLIALTMSILFGLLDETHYGNIPSILAFTGRSLSLSASFGLWGGAILLLAFPRVVRRFAPLNDKVRVPLPEDARDAGGYMDPCKIPLQKEQLWQVSPRLRIAYILLFTGVVIASVILFFILSPDVEQWTHDAIYPGM